MQAGAAIAYWVDEEPVAGPWPARVLGDGRPHHLLLLQVSGRAELMLPGLAGTIPPGGLLLLYDHRLIAPVLRLPDGGRLLWCAFDQRDAVRLPALLPRHELAEPLLRRLLAAFRRDGSRTAATGVWLAAVLQLLADEHQPQIQTGPDGRLAGLLASLDREPWLPHRIADLARRLGCSTSAFQRRCKTATGMSPRAYLSRARIACACDLLLHDDRSATEIATELGFHDLQHFNRQFRRRMGCLPTVWRKLQRS